MNTKNKPREWKRSRFTTNLVGRIRDVIRNAGYEEECGVVPLHNLYSVVVRKGEDYFNLRLDTEDLSIVEIETLEYKKKKDRITRIFRKNV